MKYEWLEIFPAVVFLLLTLTLVWKIHDLYTKYYGYENQFLIYEMSGALMFMSSLPGNMKTVVIANVDNYTEIRVSGNRVIYGVCYPVKLSETLKDVLLNAIGVEEIIDLTEGLTEKTKGKMSGALNKVGRAFQKVESKFAKILGRKIIAKSVKFVASFISKVGRFSGPIGFAISTTISFFISFFIDYLGPLLDPNAKCVDPYLEGGDFLKYEAIEYSDFLKNNNIKMECYYGSNPFECRFRSGTEKAGKLDYLQYFELEKNEKENKIIIKAHFGGTPIQ